MNEAEVQRALVSGTKLAVQRAFKWSGEYLWPGDTGAENLIQVSVAQALYRYANIHKPAICLEPTLKWISSGKFKHDTRRVDIGLMRRSTVSDTDKFFSVIEVKKAPSTFEADLEKLKTILHGVPSVKYAYLITYFQKHDPHKNMKKALSDQISETIENIKLKAGLCELENCTSLEPTPLHQFDNGTGFWRSAVLITRFTQPR